MNLELVLNFSFFFIVSNPLVLVWGLVYVDGKGKVNHTHFGPWVHTLDPSSV